MVEHDPAWARTYEAEANRIRSALQGRVLLVAHVGSTAVPDLLAKPVIDILLVLADTIGEPEYVPALESVGYRFHLREPDWHQHRLLKKDTPAVNLHVFPEDSDEPGRMIRLRDRLLTDRSCKSRYEEVKRSLATGRWSTVQAYADAKTGVIREILSSR